MSTENGTRKRRAFRWTEEAEKLVSSYADSVKNGTSKKSAASLASKLAVVTGNPRDACLRFMRQRGIGQKRRYRFWTKPEQQRLLDLLETCSIEEVAKVLQRTQGSVRSMLQRLGESAQRGRDWFTIYSLAEALHIRADEVQKWVNNGWLKSRIVQTTGIKKRIINPDDFSMFIRSHGPKVVGRRLRPEGLSFVQNFVFPPKHAHLLPLRKSRDTSVTNPEEQDAEDSDLDDIA
jgi:hypothetical protein